MGAPGGCSVVGLHGRVSLLEGLGAGLAAGVRREEEIVGWLAAAPAEAGVGELARGDGVHGLAPGAAPGGVRVGRVGGGRRGARPLADAGEVEDGEAAAAGPHRRRPPHHVVADHALHRPPRQLVLDLLHQLRHRPISPRRRLRRRHTRRRRRGGTGRSGRRMLLPLLLLRSILRGRIGGGQDRADAIGCGGGGAGRWGNIRGGRAGSPYGAGRRHRDGASAAAAVAAAAAIGGGHRAAGE